MQEEAQVDQDLQHRRRGNDIHDARGRQRVGSDQVEGDRRQHDGEHEAHEVGAKAVAFHHSNPGRETTEKMPTQAMSRKCQNRPRRNRRETTGAESPLKKTWPLMIRIQIRPTLTCVPRVPTRAKNDDRNPLRPGPAPAPITPQNTRTSRKTKPAPSTKVKSSHDSTAGRLPALDASEAK